MSWFIILFYGCILSAFGQDVPAEESVEPTSPTFSVDEDNLDQIFREKWRRRTLLSALNANIVHFSGLKGEPASAGVLAEDGRVWVSKNGGESWTLVLRAVEDLGAKQSSDEEALLGVEARIEELMDATEIRDLEELEEDFEGYSEEQLAEEVLREVDEALQQAVTDLQADLDVDPGFVTGLDTLSDIPQRIWLFPNELVFVSRTDGFWVSLDFGRRWTRVMEQRPLSLVQLSSGLLIAGMLDGVRVAIRPKVWLDVDDELDGERIDHLVARTTGVLAAGPGGVWFSEDGQSWVPRGSLLGPVTTMAASESDENEVWVIADKGLVSTVDNGESFQPSVPITVPMEDVRSLLTLDAGRILMSGRDGVMETTDGGVTWRMMNRGLSTAEGAHVFGWGPEGPQVLAGGHLYQLGPAVVAESALERLKRWIPLEVLTEAVVSRIGLEPAPEFRSRRFMAWMVPQLRVEGRYGDVSRLAWNRFSGTQYDTRGEFLGLVSLYWRPRTRTRSDVGVLSGDGNTPMIVSGSRDGASVIRMNQQLTAYRSTLIEKVVNLYSTRRDLVIEKEQMDSADLIEQVVQELMIRHVEADLDALSGNAVSRWRSE